ncbi:hypothetical protein BJY52DRAFT_82816 [Lactarius psammicola]|nr:hypothetical protein BJY52DRAFT_82816 [Lactarius psammicola]
MARGGHHSGESPHPSLESVLATVLMDPPMTAKLLHLATPGAGLQTSLRIQRLLSIAHIAVINRTLNSRLTYILGGRHIILVGGYKPEIAKVDTVLIRHTRIVLVDSRSACTVSAGVLIPVQRTGGSRRTPAPWLVLGARRVAEFLPPARRR